MWIWKLIFPITPFLKIRVRARLEINKYYSTSVKNKFTPGKRYAAPFSEQRPPHYRKFSNEDAVEGEP